MDLASLSPFLKRVCTLIADAADEETLHSAMRTEIESMQMRHYIVQDVFRKMAMYAPSFGMLGTLNKSISAVAVSRKSTKTPKIYYTRIYSSYKNGRLGIIPVASGSEMPV